MIPNSAQEYLDLLVATSLAGGFPSTKRDPATNEPTCLYRGEDGKKCVVGHVIPDEMYDPQMEKMTASALFEERPSLVPDWARDSNAERAFTEIQMVHDSLAVTGWDHDRFVEGLLKCQMFKGLTPTGCPRAVGTHC